MLEQEARTGHVLDVLVQDAGDPPQLRRALGPIALEHAQERVDYRRMELRAAAPQQLGARMLDRLRLLIRAAAHDDLECIRGPDEVRLDRDEGAPGLDGVSSPVIL